MSLAPISGSAGRLASNPAVSIAATTLFSSIPVASIGCVGAYMLARKSFGTVAAAAAADEMFLLSPDPERRAGGARRTLAQVAPKRLVCAKIRLRIISGARAA
jgi:hypothetical protein